MRKMDSSSAASPGEQQTTEEREPDSRHRHLSRKLCGWRKLCASLPIVIALFLYHVPTILDEYEAWYGYGEARDYNLPPGVMDQFRVYDSNGDGFIDPFEFAVLGIRLREEVDTFQFEDLELHPDKEVVTVKAEYQPLNIETMTKFGDKQDFYFGTPEQILPGLLLWKTARHPMHAYGIGNFRVFLPPSEDWLLGQPYYLIYAVMDQAGVHMNRYHPPTPAGKEVLIHSLLSQFHPNVFVHTRFGPHGSVAVVRASNDKYLDIVMRLHVEFQLNEEPHFPFWFTPAQFAGRLIIDRLSEHVEHFELVLPTDKQLNIDMEWITSGDANTNEVDIGYVPKMRLYTGQPSERLENGTEVSMTDIDYDFESIEWEEELPLSEAKDILDKTLYSFKKVPYYPFLEAFNLARAEGKLIHSILLWGALDDQSC